jgi:hypothetical protein
MNIEIIGLDSLSTEQKIEIEGITNHYYEKISHMVELVKLKIIIKSYHVKGVKTKYSIRSTVLTNSQKFESDSMAWDLKVPIRDSLNNIMQMIESRLHVSDKKHAK